MTRNHIHDLQAVVFCGPGHRLMPLMNEEKLPKCLLSVANRPMLYYPLCWLIQAGITDITVVAHSSAGQRLQNYFTRVFDLGKVDLVLLDEYQGTMDALLAVKSRIRNDFLAVSCDLITDFPLCRFIERARMSAASMVALLATPQTMCFGQQPKESSEPKHRLMDEGGIVVGLDGDARRLLSWTHRDDMEDGSLTMPMALLSRYPHVRLRTDLHDMHCYLLRKSLLEQPTETLQRLFSIREDLVPRLVQRQFGSADHYRCEAFIADSGYCVRANTLSSLAECGKQLTRILGAGGLRLVSQAAEIGQKTQIGNADSMIGEQSKVGDKSSVKRSVVGSFVQIGSNVKISNSIVMDYAVIEDGVRLEGCIIGVRAVVRAKSFLKDCDVGYEYAVERETNAKGEMMGSSREIYLDAEC